MNTQKKNLWDKILKVAIAILSAIAGALGGTGGERDERRRLTGC